MSESLATQYSPTQTPAKPAASASGYEGIFSPAARRHESFAAGEAPLHTSLIADQIFEEMAAEGELSNVALSRLLVLYGQKTLEAALGLLDKDRVQKLVAASGRSFFVVEGSADEPYVCFPHYCPCHYFKRSVLNRTKSQTCKHILACRISDALKKFDILEVSNEEYIEWMLKQEDEGRKPAQFYTPRRTPK